MEVYLAVFERLITMGILHHCTGSTISTLLHDRINPKDCQVLFLGDFSGFSNFLGLFQGIMANPVVPL